MAEEKKIVLSIETITDQAVMEAYGKTLNSVLGSYEDNIALLTEYNAQIKANTEQIKAIEKSAQAYGRTTQAQAETLARLTAENNKLKQAKAELVQITKNQEKVDTTINGSMENQSQLLGKLRMAWRKMTDEQKKANPEMLKTIQQLDAHLKNSDANIGNFQRNVGNYKSALSGLGGSLGKIIPKFGGLVGVVGALGAGVKAFWGEMKTTQAVGDAVAIKVAGWQGVWGRFVRMFVNADFSNFVTQLRQAKEASEQLASTRDEMFEYFNSINILRAEGSGDEEMLQERMRDANLSSDERITAGKAYKKLVEDNAKMAETAYKKLFDAELEYLSRQTGIEKDALLDYIKNYATPKAEVDRKLLESYENALETAEKLRNKYAPKASVDGFELTVHISENTKAEDFGMSADDLAKYKKAQSIISGTSDEIKELHKTTKGYKLTNDEQVKGLVDSWTNYSRVMSTAARETRRATTLINTLEKQQNDNTIKLSNKLQKSIKKNQKDEWKEQEREHKAHLDHQSKDMKDASDQAMKDIKDASKELEQYLKENPIQLVKVGLTKEEKNTLISSSVSIAQELFSMTAQLSNEATQRRVDSELDKIENEAESEKKILEAKLESGLISQKEYEKKLAELDEETASRKEELNREAFEKNKAWNLAQAAMNMALAITNIWATNKGGLIARIAETAMATASGLAQIAIISTQKYARGGELHGASHAQGGIKGFVGNRHIEAEGGEIIINKRSSAKHRKLLSLINSDNGWGDDFANSRGGSGRFFARGGVLGGYDFRTAPLPDTKGGLAQFAQQQTANIENAISALNKRIDNIRVYLPLSDIEQKSNEKRVHVSRAVL